MVGLPTGYRAVWFETVGSTNDEAKAAARAGAVDGSVYWSAHQTAGRGTHGRDWATPPGNLAVSIVMRPRLPLAFAPQAALVTAVAIADALPTLGIAKDRIRLKWPNDVLVDGGKVSGILLEGEADGSAARWLVIGTGLFIGSGLFDERATRERGVPVAVATDIGGGTSCSMLRTMEEAYKVLQLQNQNLNPLASFFMMTLGNARALSLAHEIGTLESGTQADLVVLNSRATPGMELRMEVATTLSEELFVLQTMGDDRSVVDVYVSGVPSHPSS